MFEDLTPPLPQPGQNSAADPGSELADWKMALRADFERWLESIDQIPDLDRDPEGEMPDLYSFYEQLAIFNVETRKANRRTAEAFSQWSDTLARFEGQLAPLQASAAQIAAAQSRENELPRAHCLVLIELLDRLYRLTKAFESSPPKKSWWPRHDAAWRQAWLTQQQALAILVSHFEAWLKKEGITRIPVLGQPFDPSVMTAIAVEADSHSATQTVVEEISPGYQRHGELLRPAQVKVTGR